MLLLKRLCVGETVVDRVQLAVCARVLEGVRHTNPVPPQGVELTVVVTVDVTVAIKVFVTVDVVSIVIVAVDVVSIVTVDINVTVAVTVTLT